MFSEVCKESDKGTEHLVTTKKVQGGEIIISFFVIFHITMEGKIKRVTYNVSKEIAELHMEDGEIKSVPMSEEEWMKNLQGNVVENFSKLLNE